MASVDAKKDIAFVRKEKKEDDEIARKLEEVYGKVSATRDNGYRRSKKGWECPSCGYVNFESRLACGECLDVHPAVAEGMKFQKKGGSGGAGRSNRSDTSSSLGGQTGSSSACEQLLKRLPNIKETGESFDHFTKILQISDRCYRVAEFPSAAVALGKKKAVKSYFSTLHGQKQNRDNEDDNNDDGPDDKADGEFGSCASDASGEDGPRGGCGGPGLMPYAAGETLDDYGDAEGEGDDDYDVYSGAAGSSSNNNNNTGGVSIKMDPESGDFTARMYVSPLLYGFIIGKKGAALAETQRITNTIIKVPKGSTHSTYTSSQRLQQTAAPSEEETIVIRGSDRASVTAAVVRIEAIVLENRARVGYTHFLSIPLGKDPKFSASAEAKIAQMKTALISNDPAAAEREKIDESLFQDASWMHFTLLMLRLHTHRELQLAKKLLHTEVVKAAADIFGPPLSTSEGGGASSKRKITLEGLDVMNDDLTAVDVLFVPPKPKDALVAFVSAINKIFTQNDLCLQHDTVRNDKLHATLMNTKFRKEDRDDGIASAKSADGKESARNATTKRIPFDATRVLELYNNNNGGGNGGAFFGDYVLDRVELSRMNPNTTNGVAGEDHSASRKRMTYYASEDSIEF